MRRLALLRMAWITLHRDRLGLALYAIVPVVFLSIFATVFEGFGRNGENKVSVAVLDLDDSPESRRLIEATRKMARLEIVAIERDSATAVEAAVAGGDFPAGILVPAGFGAALSVPTESIPALEVRFDPANPIAPEFAQGVLRGGSLLASVISLVIERSGSVSWVRHG